MFADLYCNDSNRTIVIMKQFETFQQTDIEIALKSIIKCVVISLYKFLQTFYDLLLVTSVFPLWRKFPEFREILIVSG